MLVLLVHMIKHSWNYPETCFLACIHSTPLPKGVFSNTETALTIIISEFSRFQRYITFDKGMRGFGENYIGFLAIAYLMRMSKIDFFPYININFFMIRMQREYL